MSRVEVKMYDLFDFNSCANYVKDVNDISYEVISSETKIIEKKLRYDITLFRSSKIGGLIGGAGVTNTQLLKEFYSSDNRPTFNVALFHLPTLLEDFNDFMNDISGAGGPFVFEVYRTDQIFDGESGYFWIVQYGISVNPGYSISEEKIQKITKPWEASSGDNSAWIEVAKAIERRNPPKEEGD